MDDASRRDRDDPHGEARDGSLFQSARRLKEVYAGASPHQLRRRIATLDRECCAKGSQIQVLKSELKRVKTINADVKELHQRCVELERENKKLKAEVERLQWEDPEPEKGNWVIGGGEAPQVEKPPVAKACPKPTPKTTQSVATFATTKDRF